MSLVPKVSDAIRSLGLAGSRVVIGVSGGPDSLALLDALDSLSYAFGLDIHVAHLDHGLRDEASAEDARFVAAEAERRGLPVHVRRLKSGEIAETRYLGVEEAARLARYSFFADVVDEVDAVGVVVAHNADDQVETVLLHLIRGSGLSGIRGMPPRTALRVPGVTVEVVPEGSRGASVDPRTGREYRRLVVLRPMLSVARSEVMVYCAERQLRPRDDASNRSNEFLRNRVRMEIIPILESCNPGFRKAILRLTTLAGEDEEYLESQAVGALENLTVEAEPEARVIDRAGYRALPTALRRRFLRALYEQLVGELSDLEMGHVEAADHALMESASGKVVEWPGGIRLITARSRAIVCLGGTSRPALSRDPRPIVIPGRTPIPGLEREILAEMRSRPCDWGGESVWHADLDMDKIGGSVWYRGRRPGDRMVPLGMTDERKLQDVMVDAGVARWERDRLPVIVSAQHVCWVAGVRLDARAQVTRDTERILCLRVS